jgi:DNA-binding winged helix-turn-helix (wHTH) protein
LIYQIQCALVSSILRKIFQRGEGASAQYRIKRLCRAGFQYDNGVSIDNAEHTFIYEVAKSVTHSSVN